MPEGIWYYTYSPYLWPSACTALFLLTLAVYSGLRRTLPGAKPLLVGCLFAAAWAIGSVMDLAAAEVSTKVIWSKFQSCVQLPLVIAITFFILEYAWPGRWLTNRNLILSTFAPVVFLGIALTNDFHHFAWIDFRLHGYGTIQQQLGIGSWIMVISTLLGFGAINLVVFGWLFYKSQQHRWPVVFMLVGQFVGRTLYAMVRAELFHFALPLELLGMGFEFLMYAIALFGFRIFDPIPMARQTAIEQLHTGMLVLDLRETVASLNPAAERILGITAKDAKGQPIQNLIPAYPPTLPDDPVETEVNWELIPGSRDFILTVSRLNDWRGLEVGRMLMLRDVTEQKKAQANLLKQQRVMATLKERDRLARELHDELAQDLAMVNLQAQIVSGLLDSGKVDQAREQLQILAKLAREAHVDVRGEIRELSSRVTQENGLPGEIQRFTDMFQQVYGVKTDLALPADHSAIFFEPKIAVQIMRILQEAFTNIRKHARATHVQVTLAKARDRVELVIEDDGIGFKQESFPETRQTFGLDIMSDRAEEIGGNVAIHSFPGQGTRVVLTVPVEGDR